MHHFFLKICNFFLLKCCLFIDAILLLLRKQIHLDLWLVLLEYRAFSIVYSVLKFRFLMSTCHFLNRSSYFRSPLLLVLHLLGHHFGMLRLRPFDGIFSYLLGCGIHELFILSIVSFHNLLHSFGWVNYVLNAYHPKLPLLLRRTVKLMSPIGGFHHKRNIEILGRHTLKYLFIFFEDPVNIDDISEFNYFVLVIIVSVKLIILDYNLEFVEVDDVISFRIRLQLKHFYLVHFLLHVTSQNKVLELRISNLLPIILHQVLEHKLNVFVIFDSLVEPIS